MTKFYLRAMLKIRSLKHYALLTWLLLGFLDTQAQTDLCLNATGTVSIDKTTGCSPLSVNITSPTNLNTVTYIYDYKIDGVLNTAPSAEVSILNNDYLTNASIGTRVFTVLQKGLNAAGQNTYACANVTVKPGVKPEFSYSLCNNSDLQIQIPLNTNNAFTSYELILDSNPPTIINSLPYNGPQIVINPPVILKLKGIGGISNGCDIENIKNIPAPIGGNIIDEFYPKIQSIELESADKVKLKFTGNLDPSQNKLFLMEKNGAFPASPFMNNVEPGVHNFSIPDSTKSYCFFIETNAGTCGSTKRSADVCTIPIYSIDSPSPITLRIDWESHQLGFLSPILNSIAGSRQITYTFNKSENPNLNSTLNPAVVNPKIDNIDCKKEYCYQFVSKLKGLYSNQPYEALSISNKRCFSRKELHPPAISSANVDVENNLVVVNFNDNVIGWPVNPEEYILEKEENNVLTKIGTIPFGNPTKFTTNEDPKALNCFRISFKDNCESISSPSDKICNILLGTKNGIDIIWSNENPFTNSVIRGYQVNGFDELTGSELPIIILNPNNNTFKVDLNGQNYQVAAKFKVQAKNQFGRISNSNVIEIPIEVKVFLPDVFTPNTSDAVNSEWFANGKLTRIAQFDIKIYDRWGAIVFQSADKDFKWDGKVNGKLLNQGNYFYKLDMSLNTGKRLYKSGKLVIIY